MKDKIIFKSNFLEVYFGLFAPCLLYYNNGYIHNNRIVISLIFFKLYFNIGGSNKQDSEAEIYGFYFKSDPDTFIFCWNNYYKSILMPWTQVVVKKQLMTSNDIIFETDNDCLSNAEIKELMSDKEIKKLCTRYYKYKDISYDYYVVLVVKRPVIFKRIDLFNSVSFIVYTTLAKPLSKHNFTHFNMNTKYNIAIPHQINVQIASMDC